MAITLHLVLGAALAFVRAVQQDFSMTDVPALINRRRRNTMTENTCRCCRIAREAWVTVPTLCSEMPWHWPEQRCMRWSTSRRSTC